VILKAFSVLDVKSEIFGRPFFCVSNGEALRAFKDLAGDKNTTVGRYPGDFKLVEIGTFDDGAGVMKHTMHNSLGFAYEFVAVSGTPVGVVPEGK